MEEYKIITEQPNYMISNYGNIKRIKDNKIINLNKKYGYVVWHKKFKNINRQYRIHRLVAKAFIDNPENKQCVDHIDNNRENNHFSNLRWATNSENSQNSKLSSSNRTGVKGVFKINDNKYRAYIKINKKMLYLGFFKTLEEAKEVRQNKANELFGEFTNLCEKITQTAKSELEILDEELEKIVNG